MFYKGDCFCHSEVASNVQKIKLLTEEKGKTKNPHFFVQTNFKQKMRASLVIAAVLLCLVALATCNLPVFLMHGVFATSNEFITMENWIKAAHPGTFCYT